MPEVRLTIDLFELFFFFLFNFLFLQFKLLYFPYHWLLLLLIYEKKKNVTSLISLIAFLSFFVLIFIWFSFYVIFCNTLTSLILSFSLCLLLYFFAFGIHFSAITLSKCKNKNVWNMWSFWCLRSNVAFSDLYDSHMNDR